ncbi:F0F1 ATP synthase subunit epsilon [Litoreibacter roseus]|uniref:ATP synthase epsilon chain n=1 Tax=Litoreibacter roseus TaxID=2601869 RepID=A0A6N6JH37_9RHOB|nr:F0F1 ATP synthase subunit epsilon [Litoreibacter roseus]GFE65277.1 ATP synthase epsilon chain [Litoreibacter roseus]
MADTMQFDLVSPERRLASVSATQVEIPGAEGDFTAMPDHAPVITTLRPGVLTVTTSGGSDDYFVTGGFAEITAEGTSVLAERAFAKADMTQEIIDDLVAEADTARGEAGAETVDAATKLLADMVAAGTAIGLSPKQPSL